MLLAMFVQLLAFAFAALNLFNLATQRYRRKWLLVTLNAAFVVPWLIWFVKAPG